MLSQLGHGSQARVKLAIKVMDSKLEEIDYTIYVPEYFAVKVYVKPYLKKQRSFNRTNSSNSASSANNSESSSRRKARAFLQNFTTALDDVYKEIEIMKKLNHPNIIKLYEIIDDPNSEKLYLVMPVADYGESIEWDPSYTPPSFAALGASGSFNAGR
jgi:[calcium/calmodulin-dependent protein kinase] kinase